jgi:hypothetical protein
LVGRPVNFGPSNLLWALPSTEIEFIISPDASIWGVKMSRTGFNWVDPGWAQALRRPQRPTRQHKIIVFGDFDGTIFDPTDLYYLHRPPEAAAGWLGGNESRCSNYQRETSDVSLTIFQSDQAK